MTSDRASLLQAVKFSDMVLTASENKITSSISAFSDPKVESTTLFEAFGRDRDLVSRTLAYIYSACQRNKLVHSCLLPSMVLHSANVEQTYLQCLERFHFLKMLFRTEFIFDPDTTAEQVSYYKNNIKINFLSGNLNFISNSQM